MILHAKVLQPRRSGTLLLLVLGFVLFVWQPLARASNIAISAEFTPSRNHPGNNAFTNTTRVSGVCSSTHAALCKSLGLWSIDTRIKGTKTGDGIRDHGRGSIYFGLPESRDILVTSDKGETVALTLRITGVAFRYANPSASRSELGVPRGCSAVFSNADWATSIMRIMIRNDNGEAGRSTCAYESLNAMTYTIWAFDIVYALETPKPLDMKAGTYTGATSYTVGGLGADIDLGDGAAPDDTQLNVYFTLKVNHLFSLEFPPGSDRAVLQPLGGWQQWTEHGKVPNTLRKDMQFQVSGSINFSVNLRCEYLLVDRRCGISNGHGAPVPLDVAITMPGFVGRKDSFWGDAHDYPLLQSSTEPPRFHPREGSVFSRSSYLRFDVRGEPIKEMVKYPGTLYKGSVVVVFDVDL